jgi:hypothetical protein
MVATTNPLLMTAAGLQNILAGIVATWNTFSVYVDPLEVFGAAGVSALLGFGMAKCLVGEEITVATRDAIRSGTIGAMYSVSTAFGYGALAGFVVCRLANALASHHNNQSQNRLSVNPKAHKLLIETLRSGSTDIDKILTETKPHWLAPEGTSRHSITRKLPSSAKSMHSAARLLNEKPLVAPNNARTINSKSLMLPSEPHGLAEIYRSVLLPSKWQGC